MEDSRILELYWQRDEQAIRETKDAYGGYCFSIANAVQENAWDAEEVVAETWVRSRCPLLRNPQNPDGNAPCSAP